ncbi:hypothetical protein HanIR_Chr06g0273881 [Helianthus annuus]|nr:hypothetical protein HanIR_Chr06g0273881 [Helianthus annuus]
MLQHSLVSDYVLNECSEAENWLREKKQLQESLPNHAEPVLLSSDIRKKVEALDRRWSFCSQREHTTFHSA